MRDPVRILLLEDDATCAEIVRTYLGVGRMGALAAGMGRLSRRGAVATRGRAASTWSSPTSICPIRPDGIATLDSLKRATDRVVVVVSGSSEPGVREAVLARGAYDFLHKDQLNPTSLERLVRLAAMQAMAFRSLRDSEERFRSLFKLSSDFYWEQDEQFRFTYLSAELALSGGRTEGAIGKTRWEMDFVGVGEDVWKAHRADLEAHRAFRDLELMRRDQDGQVRWVSVAGEPVFDAGRPLPRLPRRRPRHHRAQARRGEGAAERGALPQPDRAVVGLVLGAGRGVPLHLHGRATDRRWESSSTGTSARRAGPCRRST